MQMPLFRLTNTQLRRHVATKDVQKLFKDIRITTDPVTGLTTVWNMPQDVVRPDAVRRTRTRSDPAGRLPGGRPRRRAATSRRPRNPNCTALFFNDCAPDLFFYGNWFGEFDFKFVKKFNLTGRVTFDFNVEVYNAFTRDQLQPDDRRRATAPTCSASPDRQAAPEAGTARVQVELLSGYERYDGYEGYAGYDRYVGTVGTKGYAPRTYRTAVPCVPVVPDVP